MLDLTEAWRKAADQWVDADSAARMLEESKSAILAKWMTEMGDIPVSRAEATVKASDRWMDYVTRCVEARTKAEKLKITTKYFEMRRFDQVSRDATERTEARL